MTPADFDFVAQFLKKKSGLVIGPDKQYLLDSRLSPVARKHALTGVDAVVAKLRAGGDEALAKSVIEAMTTNESFFFRDKTPFEQFEKVMLPAILKSRAAAKRLRIWCAAASSGQEPYSLAMILREKAALLKDWKIEILGTDLSTEILAKAREAVYSQFEVQRGLPIQMLVKYFKKEGDLWRVNEDIRGMVQYKTNNLLEPFTGMGPFDIVFCRNVLIYFDTPTKASVLERTAQIMAPDGFLVLGAAETVLGVTNVFSPVEGARGVYGRAAAGASAAPKALAAAG
jgi:chemotaxis protein methyltransferase CheR